MARRDDDDAPWLAEGVREERSTLVPRARLVGGGLLAVLLAMLVALGVYLAAGKKADGSQGYVRAEDAPLIAADAGPYKVPPADPGGAQIGGVTDTLAAAGAGDDAGSAIDLTDTEEPLARPGALPTDLLPATIAPAPVVALVHPTPSASQTASERSPAPFAIQPAAKVPVPAAAARAPATMPVAKAPAAAPAKAEVTTSPPSAKPANAAKPDRPKPTAQKPRLRDAAAPVDLLPPAADPLAATLPRPKPKPTADPAAVSDTPKAKTLTTLQLGAFSSPEKAEAAWIKAGGDGALSGLAKRIEPVERDGKTLYRLRAGGVAPDAAAALCARLHAAGAACIVAQ